MTREGLGCLTILALIALVLWLTTWPCESVDPKSQAGWCSPPERSIGRAAAYGLKGWWDGVVLWP
jgi:hypothetical protein